MRIKDNEDLLILQIEFETYEEKEKVLTLINTMNTKIIGYKRDKKYFIQIESIYYIELIDKKHSSIQKKNAMNHHYGSIK